MHAFADEDVVWKLKTIAMKRRAPISEIIGEALAQYVRRHKL